MKAVHYALLAVELMADSDMSGYLMQPNSRGMLEYLHPSTYSNEGDLESGGEVEEHLLNGFALRVTSAVRRKVTSSRE
nr:hypothetical protein [Austwickia sp. TVS 96-490-7B]